MKFSEILKRFLGALGFSLALTLFYLLAYWLVDTFFRAIHWHPYVFIRLFFTSFLGIFLFGCCMFILSKVIRFGDHHDKFSYPLIQAMKRMANGDFRIDLSYYNEMFKGKGGKEHPYVKIIDSVQDMAEKLGKMEEMRQEFISNVSHEIQSPLTSIAGFAHAMKNEQITASERNHYLQIIETECNRLSKLSDNLLKLTALESESTACEMTTYRLDHELRRIILASEMQWTEKELQMHISLEPLKITADQDLLDQVWTNLLHNAIKFTPLEGTIEIVASKDGNSGAVIKIRDTGIGMSTDARIHMFERFYKADQSRNRNAGGNGLGLSIVKKIVSLHEGVIQVQSEPGGGTEITVTLP